MKAGRGVSRRTGAGGASAPRVPVDGRASTALAVGEVAAVVVDYETGRVLADCVRSVLAEGVGQVVVVENGAPGSSREALTDLGDAEARDVGLGGSGHARLEAARRLAIVSPGRNLGFGAGANRGVAASRCGDFVLVCNPDVRLHPGAVAALVAALARHPEWAIVGPRILTVEGDPYPSARRFPSAIDAAGHALLGIVHPTNRFTRRYRTPELASSGVATVDWVSGACFLVRRAVFEELGGFDERYFMFAEDLDLCWRARQAGWGVGFEPAAVVTHIGGVARRRNPYRMEVAHHRSALRFAVRTSTGWRRLLLPFALLVLGARLVLACVRIATGRPV